MSRDASAGGYRLLKRLESFSPKAYPDAGKYSIGYGHQILPTEQHYMTYTMPEPEADRLLRQDVAKKTAHINKVIKVPLTQNMMDALISLVYNIGEGNFTEKTSTLVRKLNEGDYFGAAEEFPRWNKSQGKENAVLSDRRLIERTLFEAGLA